MGGSSASDAGPWVSTTGTGPQRPRNSSTSDTPELSAQVTSTAGRSHAIHPAASSGSVVPRTEAGPKA